MGVLLALSLAWAQGDPKHRFTVQICLCPTFPLAERLCFVTQHSGGEAAVLLLIAYISVNAGILIQYETTEVTAMGFL